MLTDTELYFVDVIKGKRKGFLSLLVRSVLRFLSWIYRAAVFFRNLAFDYGWIRLYSPPVPVVVSVGNIVAGGTGKTPVTLLLGKHFESYSIAVITRGYRSPAEELSSPLVLSVGNGPLYPSSFCGDEPYLLAENLPFAKVYVGRNRLKASSMAAKAEAKLILLDDGMQYRYLARDLEVVVVDGSDPFGKGYFLPRGFLREDAKSLSRSDIIIVNHIKTRAEYLTCKHLLGRYTQAPIVAMRPILSRIVDLKGKELSIPFGTRVGLFCGIANPDHFKKLLQKEGLNVVAECVTADHVAQESETLKQFGTKCIKERAEVLLCTEKDKVRLNDAISCPLPIGWVKMDLQIVEGEEHWTAFLDRIKTQLISS